MTADCFKERIWSWIVERRYFFDSWKESYCIAGKKWSGFMMRTEGKRAERNRFQQRSKTAQKKRKPMSRELQSSALSTLCKPFWVMKKLRA